MLNQFTDPTFANEQSVDESVDVIEELQYCQPVSKQIMSDASSIVNLQNSFDPKQIGGIDQGLTTVRNNRSSIRTLHGISFNHSTSQNKESSTVKSQSVLTQHFNGYGANKQQIQASRESTASMGRDSVMTSNGKGLKTYLKVKIGRLGDPFEPDEGFTWVRARQYKHDTLNDDVVNWFCAQQQHSKVVQVTPQDEYQSTQQNKRQLRRLPTDKEPQKKSSMTPKHRL